MGYVVDGVGEVALDRARRCPRRLICRESPGRGRRRTAQPALRRLPYGERAAFASACLCAVLVGYSFALNPIGYMTFSRVSLFFQRISYHNIADGERGR